MTPTQTRLIFDVSMGATFAKYLSDFVANGVCGAIFRAGEGLTIVDNVRPQAVAAIGASIRFGLYWAIWPWLPVEPQIDKFLSVSKPFSAKSLMLDCELPDNGAAYLRAYEYLKAHTTLPVIIYSGNWCIDRYFPSLKSWIGREVYLDANCENQPFGVPQTWELFHAKILTLKTIIYPAGYPLIRGWQFAGNLKCPMWGFHSIDFSLLPEEVWQYCFNDGPRPAYLDAAPVVVPPVNLVHYVVANTLIGGKGTVIMTKPDWDSVQVKTVLNGTDLYIDPTYTATPGWLRVVKPVIGYADARRVVEAHA
jgi:hypothetical protein